MGERLMEATSSADQTADDEISWGPVVDDFSTKPFLPMPPLEAMMEGKFNRVPFVSGTVKHDGALFVPFAKPLLQFWSEADPRMLAAIKDNRNPTTDEHRQMANILWNYYNHESENKTLDSCLSDMLTDGYFFVPDQLTVKLLHVLVNFVPEPMVFLHHLVAHLVKLIPSRREKRFLRLLAEWHEASLRSNGCLVHLAC